MILVNFERRSCLLRNKIRGPSVIGVIEISYFLNIVVNKNHISYSLVFSG